MRTFIPGLRNGGRRGRRLNRKGQALAEMAIILPILLLLVVGIIEMSMAWRTFQVVTNAAREGARVALLPTADLAQVRARVQQSLEAAGVAYADDRLTAECIDGGAVIDTVCGPGATGTEARIRIEAPYTFRLLEPVGRLACIRGDCAVNFGTITIASVSTMRNE